MKGLILPAIVERLTTRSDGTIAVTIGCQEMAPSTGGELLGYRGKLASVYISLATIQKSETEQIDALEPDIPGAKSPSKRLRDVLFVLHSHTPEGFRTFDEFYRFKMNEVTEHFKSEIPTDK